MSNSEKANRRLLIWLGLIEIVSILLVTFTCQWFIFGDKVEYVALSVLIGTCTTLFGCLAGLLASPYGAEDEKRLSKVSTIIFTLITGYVLGKMIDPLVVKIMDNPGDILELRTGANILIGLIGFLGGFLSTYVFRAYITSPNNKPVNIQGAAQTNGEAKESGQTQTDPTLTPGRPPNTPPQANPALKPDDNSPRMK